MPRRTKKNHNFRIISYDFLSRWSRSLSRWSCNLAVPQPILVVPELWCYQILVWSKREPNPRGVATKKCQKMAKKISDHWIFSKLFLWKYVWIISLKAPGSYLDQFGSNRIFVLLCEGPKPNISLISGCLNPRGTLIYGL